MIDFFHNLYARIGGKYLLLQKLRFYSAQRFIVRALANFLLPVYFKLTSRNAGFSLPPAEGKKVQIIVSLTSFPMRINKVWLVIECLLRQSKKPDKIVLWLSKEQFPCLESLPANLLKLRNRGLQIELKEDDLRSHKKYYYFLQQFPDDIMVTVDDDIFYPTNTIANLVKGHKAFPNAVIARYGFKIRVKNNQLEPYSTWQANYGHSFPEYSLFFGSGGGVLFPAGSLPQETLKKDVFSNLCLNADDVWLNSVCRINRRKIYKVTESECSILPVINRNNVTLATKNLFENQNDKQISEVRKYFISTKNIDPFSDLFVN